MSFYTSQETVNNDENNLITIPETPDCTTDKYQRLQEHSVIVKNPGFINHNRVNGNINDYGRGTTCRNRNYITNDKDLENLKILQRNQEGSLYSTPIEYGGVNASVSSEDLSSPNRTFEMFKVQDNSDILNENVLGPANEKAVDDIQMQSLYYENGHLSGNSFEEFSKTKPCKITPNRSKSDSFVYLNRRDNEDFSVMRCFSPIKTTSFQNIETEHKDYKQYNRNTAGIFTESYNSLNFQAAGDTEVNQDIYNTRYSSPMSVSSHILHSWLEESDSNGEPRLVICESVSDISVSNFNNDDNNDFMKNKNRKGCLDGEKTEGKEPAKLDFSNENVENNTKGVDKLNSIAKSTSENWLNNSIYLDAFCDDEEACQETSIYVSCIDDNEEDDGNFTDSTQIYVDSDTKDQPHPLKPKVVKLKDEMQNHKSQCAAPYRKSFSKKMDFEIETHDFKNATFKLFFSEYIDGILNDDDEGIDDITSGKKLYEMKNWIEKLITHNSSDRNIQIVDLIHLISSCVVLSHTAFKSLRFINIPCHLLGKDLQNQNSGSHFDALLMNRLKTFVKDGLILSDLAFSLYERVMDEDTNKKNLYDYNLLQQKEINTAISTTMSDDINCKKPPIENMSDLLSSETIPEVKEDSPLDIKDSEVLSSKVSSPKTSSDSQDRKTLSTERKTFDLKEIASETISDSIDLKLLSSKTMLDTINTKVLCDSASLASGIDSKVAAQTTKSDFVFNVLSKETVSDIIESKVYFPNDNDYKDNSSNTTASNLYSTDTKSYNRDFKVFSCKSVSDNVSFKALSSETKSRVIDSNELSSKTMPDNKEANVNVLGKTSTIMNPLVSSSETETKTDAIISKVISVGTFSNSDNNIKTTEKSFSEKEQESQTIKETKEQYNPASTICLTYQSSTKPVRRKLKLINEYLYSPAPCLDEVAVNLVECDGEKPLKQQIVSKAGSSEQGLNGSNPDNVLKEKEVSLTNYGLSFTTINDEDISENKIVSLNTENVSPTVCNKDIKYDSEVVYSGRLLESKLKDTKNGSSTSKKHLEYMSHLVDYSLKQNRNCPDLEQNHKQEKEIRLKYTDDVLFKRRRPECASPTSVCREFSRKETIDKQENTNNTQYCTQETLKMNQNIRTDSAAKKSQSYQNDSEEVTQEFPQKIAETKYIQAESKSKTNNNSVTSLCKSLSDPERAKTMFNNLKRLCSPVLTSLVNSRGHKCTQVSEIDFNGHHSKDKINLSPTDSNDKNQNRKVICKDKQSHSENKGFNGCDDDRAQKTKTLHFKYTPEADKRNNKFSQTNNDKNVNQEVCSVSVLTPDKHTSKIKTPRKTVTHGEKRKVFQGHESNVAKKYNGSPCKIRKTSTHVKEAEDNESLQRSPCKMRKCEENTTDRNVNKTSKYHEFCGSNVKERHVFPFTTKRSDRDSTTNISSSKVLKPVVSTDILENSTTLVFKEKQANRNRDVDSYSNVTKSHDGKIQNIIKKQKATDSNGSLHNKDCQNAKADSSTIIHSFRDDSVRIQPPTNMTSSKNYSHRKNDQDVLAKTASKEHIYKKDKDIVIKDSWSTRHIHRKDSQNLTTETSHKRSSNEHGKHFRADTSSQSQEKDLTSETAGKKQNFKKDCKSVGTAVTGTRYSNQKDDQSVAAVTSINLKKYRKDGHSFTEETTLKGKIDRCKKKSEIKSNHGKTKHSESAFEIVTATKSGHSVALQVSIHSSSKSVSSVSLSGVRDSSRHQKHFCTTPPIKQYTEKLNKYSESSIGDNFRKTEKDNMITSDDNRFYVSSKHVCHGNRKTNSSPERINKAKHKRVESSERGTVIRKASVKDHSNRHKRVQNKNNTKEDGVTYNEIEPTYDQSLIGLTLKTERQLAAHVSTSQSELFPESPSYITKHIGKNEEKQKGRLENKENYHSGKNTDCTKSSNNCTKESGNSKILDKDLGVNVGPSIKNRSSPSNVLEEVTCENLTVETSSSSDALNIVSGQRNELMFSSISDSSSEDEEHLEPFYGTGFSLLHSLSHTLLDDDADLPPLILPSKKRNNKNNYGNLKHCHRTDLNSQGHTQKISAFEYSQQKSGDTQSLYDLASSSNNTKLGSTVNRSSDRESLSSLSRKNRHKRKYLTDYACTSSSSEEVIPESRQRGLQSKKECFMILDRVYNYRLAEPFRHEVRSQDVPGYYLVVKRGMCLDMIAHKLRDNIYEKVEDFVTDMRLIFSNCRLFHLPGSPIYEAGQAVERYFDQIVKDVFPDLNFNPFV